MVIRTRIPASVIGLFAACAVLSACSDPLAYTIVNETDRELTAWGFREPCESTLGYRDDYSDVLVIPPHETADYYETWGNGSDTDCIQVVDESRRLVLAEPYELGTTYVAGPIEGPGGIRLPEFGDLPKQPWLDGQAEDISENPFLYALFTPILLASIAALIILPYGIYRAVRDLRSYRRPSSR